MTTLENANDGIPADAPQEKLEWVTPKISLMATTETDGGGKVKTQTEFKELAGPS